MSFPAVQGCRECEMENQAAISLWLILFAAMAGMFVDHSRAPVGIEWRWCIAIAVAAEQAITFVVSH